MKKIILFIVVFISLNNVIVNAQNRNTQLKTNQFFEYIDRYNEDDIYNSSNSSAYKGTPFYKKSFQNGKVYLGDDVLEENVVLRYNALADEIEYKESLTTEEKRNKALIKSENIHAYINHELFIYKKEKGYFLVLFDGNNVSLLKKISKKYFPIKKAATSLTKDFPAEFKDRFAYYLLSKEDKLEELPNSKNKKIKFFNDYENSLKKYCSENKLDLDNQDDLIKLVTYLDKNQH